LVVSPFEKGGLCSNSIGFEGTFGTSACFVPKVAECGFSSIALLLYCLCSLSLLAFAYGLFCLAFKHPYIVIPVAFAGAVLFSILAFRCKPCKESSKATATNSHHPNTCFVALENLKSLSAKGAYPKAGEKIRKRLINIARTQMTARTMRKVRIVHQLGETHDYYKGSPSGVNIYCIVVQQ
jgi:hypothetical protein